jgi:hypothetical protein
MFNVTNHTHFVYSSGNALLTNWAGPTLAQVGQPNAPGFSSSYGVLSVDGNSAINRAVQLALRLEF